MRYLTRFLTTIIAPAVAASLTASTARAELGIPEDLPEKADLTTNLGLHSPHRNSDEIVLGLQSSSSTLGLTATNDLLGKYGVSVQDVIRELAPHLEETKATIKHVESFEDSFHEYWELHYENIKLHNAYIRLHFRRNQLTFIRAALPQFRLSASDVKEFTFIPPVELGYTYDQVLEKRVEQKVIANVSGLPAPAWLVHTLDSSRDKVTTQLIEAQSGALLESFEDGLFPFHQEAMVFLKGPQDGSTQKAKLNDLAGPGPLDGAHFRVYAPDEGSPRVQVNGSGVLAFDPNAEEDRVNFDEIQAYYTATRGLAWFNKEVAYVAPLTPIKISVNDLIRGSASNAVYFPPPFGPEIKVGRGTDTVRNLARDSDVILHELSHHIIYQHITSDRDESGMLHEGFADYFAYAINGDPHLGETVVAGKPYLRTGTLPPGDRYDLIDPKESKHRGGEIWSAFLWSLHSELEKTTGTAPVKTIYGALPYAGPNAGFRDALLGLINADRDLSPLPADHPEFGVFGKGKCAIIRHAVNRGFATFIEDLDGGSCQLKLADLAQESRDIYEEAHGLKGKGSGNSITLFGKKCSTLPIDGRLPIGPLLLFAPLVWMWMLRRKNRNTVLMES